MSNRLESMDLQKFAATRVSDIIVPEVFNNYLIQETTEKSALIQSGIAQTDPRITVPDAGDTVNMPFFNDITGDPEAIQSDSALTPEKIDTGKDVARILEFGKAWSSEDLAAELAGDDPMRAIASKLADYWTRQQQKIAIASLNGVFADNVNNDSGDLVLDVAEDDVDTNGAVELDGGVILDGSQKLGDAKGNLTALAVHSQVHTNLQKKQLIEYFPESDVDVGFGTYNGKTLVIDDGVPVEDAPTSGKKYTSYLFARGAFGYEEGKPKTPTETDRNSLKGEDILINRKKWIMHPRGFAWQEANVAGEMPTLTELSDPTNYDRVYPQKLSKVVEVITNG
jgi:hypothetical protein